MVKRLVIGCAVAGALAVVGLAAYVFWFVRQVGNGPGATRAGVRVSAVHRRADSVEIEITVVGAAVAVVEVSLKKELADALGAGPPAGFVAEPLPLTEEERKDPESVERAAQYNRETIRYVGRLAVAPGPAGLVRLPAQKPRSGRGRIDLQYEEKIGLGGSIGFLSAVLPED